MMPKPNLLNSHDTKIMLNSVKAKTKQSSLEKGMGEQINAVFIAQVRMRKAIKHSFIFCSFYSVQWQLSITPHGTLGSATKCPT